MSFERKGVHGMRLLRYHFHHSDRSVTMRVIKAGLGAVCSLSLIFSPVSAAAAQPVSPAVVSTSRQVFANFYNTVSSGNTSPAPWASAAAAAKILFAHYNEVGLTASEQERILSNTAAFINFQFGAAQIHAVCARLESEGINIACSKVASLMNSTTEERQRVVSLIQTVGLAALEAQILAILQSRESLEAIPTALPQPLSPKAKLRLAVFTAQSCRGAWLRPVDITGDNCKHLKIAIALLAFTGEEELALALYIYCVYQNCC